MHGPGIYPEVSLRARRSNCGRYERTRKLRMKLGHEYLPVDHTCHCNCHDGAQLFEYLPCCEYQGLLRSRPRITPELLALIKKLASQRLAEEICSVQPMPSDLMKRVMDGARDEKWLIENGYEPVSDHRLMWIKKDDGVHPNDLARADDEGMVKHEQA